jgi:hypothetical protein
LRSSMSATASIRLSRNCPNSERSIKARSVT